VGRDSKSRPDFTLLADFELFAIINSPAFSPKPNSSTFDKHLLGFCVPIKE
jgi:hypothetical protein